jgi:hypothetical protein
VRAIRRSLIGVTVAAAAVGISVAAPAAADPSNDCQSSGGVTVCAQGGVMGAGRGPPVVAPGGGGIPPYSGGQCVNAYGTYQNCIVQQGILRPPR